MTAAKARLLVVEDSATQAAALSMLLENEGYAVSVARRGERALEVMQEQPVDLVLSDVIMPGMGGYELCRRIREVPAWNHTPVVLLTSLTDPLAIVRGLAAGAEHYVTKPYAPQALLSRIRAVLEQERRPLDEHPRPFTVWLLGTPFTISATKEHILDLLVSSYSDLMRSSETIREAEQRARFLADVTELLSASLDIEQVLRSLARLVVQRIADVCAVDLIRADGTVETVAHVDAVDPHDQQASASRATLPAESMRAVQARTIQSLPNIDGPMVGALTGSSVTSASLRGRDAHAMLVVPLVGRERVLALLYCIAAPASALLSEENIQLLEDVARRAALAVENAALYAEAQRATRARDDVLAVVSHDLRNPLNTIHMSASFMIDISADGVPPATLTSQLRVIQRATRRANTLIADLLDVSRIDAGSFAVEAEPASAAALIHDAALELEPLASGSGLALKADWVGEDVQVMADRGRITQVFSNLVGNALKFTKAGGAISIRGQRAPHGAEFQVSDTGAGISADHLPHLFDRFWKVSQSERTGAGLGLSIVRGIVERHRGELTVSSTPGVGTTFTFTLGAAQP